MPYKNKADKAAQNKRYKEENRERINEYHKEYQYNRSVPKRKKEYSLEYRRDKMLQRLYGITLVQYNELLEKQNNCCYICERPASTFSKALAVDHDHKTLEIRGLLCTHCNRTVIGRHRDPIIFKRAHEYLSRPFPGWKAPGNRKRKARRPRRK